MLSFLKKIFSAKNRVDLRQLSASGAIIVDVRMPGEFQSGHIKGAINVPLPGLKKEFTRLKKLNKPVITCCLSGTRSMVAKRMLSQQGIEVYNGGGWQSLASKIGKR